MKIVSLILKISTYIPNDAPGQGKGFVDGINERDKSYLRKHMDMLSKSLNTTFEGLGTLHYASNKSTVGFEEQCKDILTEASHISGENFHSKAKK